MKASFQTALFVAAGLLTLQLSLAVPAQEVPSSQAVAPGFATTPAERRVPEESKVGSDRLAAVRPAKGKANKPGKADDTGDPALGGERHPLYRLPKSDT